MYYFYKVEGYYEYVIVQTVNVCSRQMMAVLQPTKYEYTYIYILDFDLVCPYEQLELREYESCDHLNW